VSGQTVLYELVHEDAEHYWSLGLFHDQPTPQAIADRANALSRDLGHRAEAFRVQELKVMRADAVPLDASAEDFVRAIEGLDDSPSLEYWADEALLHLEAMRSAPEDYDPEMLARWGIER
jgi:hypothetical protein